MSEQEMQLLTKGTSVTKSGRSPFLDSLHATTESNLAELVCPYMSVEILDGVLTKSAKVRIITDAEAWLRAYPRAKRKRILAFVRRHIHSLRHCRGVHAKVAISPQKLLFGSANFTQSGMFENEEFCAVSDASEHVTVARQWFADLWDRSHIIDLAQLRRYEASLPAKSDAELAPARVLPPAKRRSTQGTKNPPRPPLKSERDLVRYLKEIPDGAEWVGPYFGLIKLLYDELDLAENDPRLALTMPRTGRLLPLSVNNRYSLFPNLQDNGTGVLVLVPNGIAGASGKWQGGEYDGEFDETPKDEGSPPGVMYFPSLGMVRKPAVLSTWREGIARQLAYGKRSANRGYHSHAALRASLDLEYRREILGKAYGEGAVVALD